MSPVSTSTAPSTFTPPVDNSRTTNTNSVVTTSRPSIELGGHRNSFIQERTSIFSSHNNITPEITETLEKYKVTINSENGIITDGVNKEIKFNPKTDRIGFITDTRHPGEILIQIFRSESKLVEGFTVNNSAEKLPSGRIVGGLENFGAVDSLVGEKTSQSVPNYFDYSVPKNVKDVMTRNSNALDRLPIGETSNIGGVNFYRDHFKRLYFQLPEDGFVPPGSEHRWQRPDQASLFRKYSGIATMHLDVARKTWLDVPQVDQSKVKRIFAKILLEPELQKIFETSKAHWSIDLDRPDPLAETKGYKEAHASPSDALKQHMYIGISFSFAIPEKKEDWKQVKTALANPIQHNSITELARKVSLFQAYVDKRLGEELALDAKIADTRRGLDSSIVVKN